jgi:hypothetical protein
MLFNRRKERRRKKKEKTLLPLPSALPCLNLKKTLILHRLIFDCLMNVM